MSSCIYSDEPSYLSFVFIVLASVAALLLSIFLFATAVVYVLYLWMTS